MLPQRLNVIWLQLFALVVLLLPRSAYAYLDPGTGSFLTQILAASVISLLIFLRAHWRKIFGVFTSARAKNTQDDSQPADAKSEH